MIDTTTRLDSPRLAKRCGLIWTNEAPYGGPIPADNPYGDGHAGERIARILAQSLAGRSVASA